MEERDITVAPKVLDNRVLSQAVFPTLPQFSFSFLPFIFSASLVIAQKVIAVDTTNNPKSRKDILANTMLISKR